MTMLARNVVLAATARGYRKRVRPTADPIGEHFPPPGFEA